MGTPSAAAVSAATSGVLESARVSLMERLFDTLLHDARNPLNALVINLDVLTEKLRRPEGQVPPMQEKNLKAIREQVFRVDSVLRSFAESLAPTSANAPGEVDFSERLNRAQELLQHELRRSRAQLTLLVPPHVRVTRSDPTLLSFLSLGPMLRAILRSEPGQEVSVSLIRDRGEAVLSVRDLGVPQKEPFPEAPAAIALAAERLGGRAYLDAGSCEVRLPSIQLSTEVVL